MVDVGPRPTGPNPAHLAGLRRLSARAASVRNSLHSFSALSDRVITHLRNSGIHAESTRAEFRKQRSLAEKHSAKCPLPAPSRHSLDAAAVTRRRPKWVEGFVGLMGSVLREGGWSESDISEMVSGSGSGFLDNEGVVDAAIVFKAERFSHELRKSGWSSEDVSDALGLGSHFPPPHKIQEDVEENWKLGWFFGE
ncbi:hypothetical protein Fmac_014769 [Flemingia macrophylla]|uniref:Uncharacterized protein n=1 Tax=Flemingia macrophylla TaxID=520843 RepID=A0ABD1MCP6_9FABA